MGTDPDPDPLAPDANLEIREKIIRIHKTALTPSRTIASTSSQLDWIKSKKDDDSTKNSKR